MHEAWGIRLGLGGTQQSRGGVDVHPAGEFGVTVDQRRDDGGQVNDRGG
jgi:ribosomal protein L13E